MSQQLRFDILDHRPAMGREDFFVSEANAAALAGIETWQTWPMSKTLLIGPEAAGKTHLTHVWAGLADAEIVAADALPTVVEDLVEAQAVAVEDADRIAGHREAEVALFHLHNALWQRQAPLLITARSMPERWGMDLPDLASRMAQCGVLRMAPPDDMLLTALMLKLAHDLNLAVKPATIQYAAARIDRSCAAALGFINRLDARSIDQQRAPTRDLAREVLAELARR